MDQATDVAGRLDQLSNFAQSSEWANRIHALALAVEDAQTAGSYDTVDPSTSNWAEVDLHDSFPSDVVRHPGAGVPGWIAWLDIGRVVGIFLPIVVTWFGIWLATEAYAALLAENKDYAKQPFIALWQTGFHGHIALGATLSRVALLDFSIILLVIAASAVGSIARHRAEQKTDALVDSLENEFAGLLTDATLVLADVRLSSPLRFKQELTSAAAKLTRLHGRIDDTAAAVAKSVAEAGALVGSVAGSVNDLTAASARASTDLMQAVDESVMRLTEAGAEASRQVGASMDATSAGLTAAAKVVWTAAVELTSAVGLARSAAESAAASGEESAAKNASLLDQVEVAVTALAAMSGDFSTVSAELGSAIAGVSAIQDQLAETVSSERRLHSALGASAKSTADQLQSVTTEIGSLTPTLAALSSSLVQTTSGIEGVYAKLDTQIGAASAETRDLLDRQAEVNDLLRRTIATVEVGIEQARASVLDMNEILEATAQAMRDRQHEVAADPQKEEARTDEHAGAMGTAADARG